MKRNEVGADSPGSRRFVTGTGEFRQDGEDWLTTGSAGRRSRRNLKQIRPAVARIIADGRIEERPPEACGEERERGRKRFVDLLWETGS